MIWILDHINFRAIFTIQAVRQVTRLLNGENSRLNFSFLSSNLDTTIQHIKLMGQRV